MHCPPVTLSPQLPLCFETPLDPTAEVTTDAQAARVRARMDEIWALAEARWQQGGRPLRFVGCSYFVVNTNQHSDRSAYLSKEENDEVHQLTIQHSLFVNDPQRARQRNLARVAQREKAALPLA